MIHGLNLEPHEYARLIPAHPVLVCYRGSHSHGTYVPPTDPNGIDDIDLVAFYIPPDLSDYFGIQRAERGSDVKIREYDCAAYEITHAARLLMQANPNILSALWMKDYLVLDTPGRILVENRHLFATKVAAASFMGYAHSQLKRMTAISGEGSECCEGEKFHTVDCKENKTKGRGSTKKFATGFMGAKRKALVKQFGYDTKNAAHLIRLLRMGIEFLRDGKIYVDRSDFDAQQLIAIKRGEWTLEQVKSVAEDLFSSFDSAKRLSMLPDYPDEQKVNELLVGILCQHWNSHVSMISNDLNLARLSVHRRE